MSTEIRLTISHLGSEGLKIRITLSDERTFRSVDGESPQSNGVPWDRSNSPTPQSTVFTAPSVIPAAEIAKLAVLLPFVLTLIKIRALEVHPSWERRESILLFNDSGFGFVQGPDGGRW